MSTRTAFRLSKGLSVAVAVTAVWTALVWFGVVRGMNWGTANYVGPAVRSGVVGLVVLTALLALLAGLLVLPRGTDPEPAAWPPE